MLKTNWWGGRGDQRREDKQVQKQVDQIGAFVIIQVREDGGLDQEDRSEKNGVKWLARLPNKFRPKQLKDGGVPSRDGAGQR